MRRALAPYTDERDPLELVARMSVGGCFRAPSGAAATSINLGQMDIAGALGFMPDKLARETAIAVATRAEGRELVKVVDLAYGRIAEALQLLRPIPMDLDKAENRHRLRLVSFDALHDIVWPEKTQPYWIKAREKKMRLGTYRAAHRCASALFAGAFNEAAYDFERRLFSHLTED